MTAKASRCPRRINFGWEVTKSNFLFLIGVLLIAGVIGALPQLGGNRDEVSALACVLGIVSFVLNTIISMGLAKITLEFVDRRSPGFGRSVRPALVPQLLHRGANLRVHGRRGARAVRRAGHPRGDLVLALYSFVIVDRGLGPIESLSRSAEITKGARMSLFLFGLLILGINFLGFLALIIGLFVTVPISMIAWGYVFRQLEAQTTAAGA